MNGTGIVLSFHVISFVISHTRARVAWAKYSTTTLRFERVDGATQRTYIKRFQLQYSIAVLSKYYLRQVSTTHLTYLHAIAQIAPAWIRIT